MAQQKSVTLVISHVLDPEHGQRYEAWLGKIMPIAAEFPGHLGALFLAGCDDHGHV